MIIFSIQEPGGRPSASSNTGKQTHIAYSFRTLEILRHHWVLVPNFLASTCNLVFIYLKKIDCPFYSFCFLWVLPQYLLETPNCLFTLQLLCQNEGDCCITSRHFWIYGKFYWLLIDCEIITKCRRQTEHLL